MSNICDLPEDILGEITKRLPTIDDVLALQTAHPKLSNKINRTFWRSPKCLCLSADGEIEPHLIFEETKQMKFRKPSWPRLQSVLTKTKNLKELVLGDCGKYFSEETIFKALIFLQKSNGIKLQKILAFYQNLEGFCLQQNSKDVWPSKRTHDQLCELVKKSGKSLTFLLLGLNNSDEFVSISRSSSPESKTIQIQYCHQPTFHSRLVIFYPLLSGFAAASGSPIKSLTIRMKVVPSMANIILDHCVQCCAPAHSESRLENITVTFTAMPEKENEKSAEIKEFINFHNTRNLKSLVWFFDVNLPEDKVEKLCCPTGGDCPYDIFVQTPEMKKIYPGIPANLSLNNSPKLLRCIS